jgi:hypothetical protein
VFSALRRRLGALAARPAQQSLLDAECLALLTFAAGKE